MINKYGLIFIKEILHIQVKISHCSLLCQGEATHSPSPHRWQKSSAYAHTNFVNNLNIK